LDRKEQLDRKKLKHLIDTDKNVIIVAKITEKLKKQCNVNPNENEKSKVICNFLKNALVSTVPYSHTTTHCRYRVKHTYTDHHA
jgi:signal recognition particle GTPase